MTDGVLVHLDVAQVGAVVFLRVFKKFSPERVRNRDRLPPPVPPAHRLVLVAVEQDFVPR